MRAIAKRTREVHEVPDEPISRPFNPSAERIRAVLGDSPVVKIPQAMKDSTADSWMTDFLHKRRLQSNI